MLKEKEMTNIIQVEAKDLVREDGEVYTIKYNNKKKYKATLDYCLDALKLEKLFGKRKNSGKDSKLFYTHKENGHQYTDAIISIQFNYSLNKDINTSKLREMLYKDGFDLAFEDKNKRTKKKHYIRFKRSSGSSRVGKCLFIETKLYNAIMEWSYMGLDHRSNIDIDLASIEAYISLTTSSIIDTMKIEPKNILLVDDYVSKFTDTIMETTINSTKEKYFNKKTNKYEYRDRLVTRKKKATIENTIWDGQSLIDKSLIPKKYEKAGMLLLRNRFVKSACFNSNIQQFFKDNGITDIKQLNKNCKTIATDIKDIKFITTKSSIKYLKFGEWEDFITRLEPTWGIVKTDHPTHHFNGKMVQTHYQLLNTLNLEEEEVKQLLEPSKEYYRLLKQDIDVFRTCLKLKMNEEAPKINTTNDLMMYLLTLNNEIQYTDLFYNFRKDYTDSFKKNLQKGHILVNGNYSTLFGNGLEMLKSTLSEDHENHFNGTSTLTGDNVMCKNFKYDIDLLGCRSPHVTMGNLWVAHNTYNKEIDTYFNLSKQIIYLNSMNNNVLERLSSADFDSDQLLLTDNKLLLNKAKEHYNKFLVPTSNVSAKKTLRKNNVEDKCDLDIKTSTNLIGDIVNLSQELNTYLWDKINKENLTIESEEIQELYKYICQLDVMSCIEIDKAKKEYKIDNKVELDELREKYSKKDKAKEYVEEIEDKKGNMSYKYYYKDLSDNKPKWYHKKNLKFTKKIKDKKIKPDFFYHMMSKKYKYNYLYKKYDTTMDYLETIIEKDFSKIKCKSRRGKKRTLKEFMITSKGQNGIKTRKANNIQIKRIIEDIEKLKDECDAIWKSENLENKEKFLKTKKLQDNLIKNYSKKKVYAPTIKKLINKIYTDDNVKLGKLERKLITIMYNVNKEEFKKVFEDTFKTFDKNNIRILKQTQKQNNVVDVVKIYDINFRKIAM